MYQKEVLSNRIQLQIFIEFYLKIFVENRFAVKKIVKYMNYFRFLNVLLSEHSYRSIVGYGWRSL